MTFLEAFLVTSQNCPCGYGSMLANHLKDIFWTAVVATQGARKYLFAFALDLIENQVKASCFCYRCPKLADIVAFEIWNDFRIIWVLVLSLSRKNPISGVSDSVFSAVLRSAHLQSTFLFAMQAVQVCSKFRFGSFEPFGFHSEIFGKSFVGAGQYAVRYCFLSQLCVQFRFSWWLILVWFLVLFCSNRDLALVLFAFESFVSGRKGTIFLLNVRLQVLYRRIRLQVLRHRIEILYALIECTNEKRLSRSRDTPKRLALQ